MNILEIVKALGLEVDYDRWSDKGHEWIRYTYRGQTFVLYKKNSDEKNMRLVSIFLVRVGKDEIRNEFKHLMGIE